MATDGSGTINGVPTINGAACSGCGRCVAACPEKVVTLETIGFHKNALFRYPERCNCCGRCLEACPLAAIIC